MATTELAQYAPAIRELARRWLPVVADDPAVRAADGDFVCSPTGLWLGLSVAAAGADGSTARELEALLGGAGPQAATAATAAARGLAAVDGLAVVTGVWSGTPLYRRFRESLPEVVFGHLDLSDHAALDLWVRQATGGLVTSVPPPPESGDALLMLANALAFKADWQGRFLHRHTHDREFTDGHGVTHQVPTMFKSLPRPTHAWTAPTPSGTPAQVVAMRCQADGDRLPAQVSLVLGEPGLPAAEVLPAAWSAHGLRRPMDDVDQVTLALPRLSLRTELDLVDHLAPLGAASAASRSADFSGLSPEPTRIGRISQGGLLKVHEQGIEAAVVTAMYSVTRSVSGRERRIRHIAFDRPFGLVVFADDSGIPLFTAWQSSAPAPAATR